MYNTVMKIGIDLDSVLADLMDPLIRFHNERYNKKHTIKDHVTYNLTEVWGVSSEEVLHRIYEFYESPYMDEVLPMSGSVEGVNKLQIVHDLHVITARPYDIEKKTVDWLDRYFPGKFKSIYHTNWVSSTRYKKRNKSELCVEYGVECMIEDHLDFATDIADENIEVLLLDSPWNQSNMLPDKIHRVFTWEEIVEKIHKKYPRLS